MSAFDPYYFVRDEIEKSVIKLDGELGKWGQLPAVSKDKSSLTKRLMSNCDTVKSQLDELDKAIGVAEKDPIKFGVNSVEIQRRRSWTNTTRVQVSNYRKTLQLFDDSLRIPHAVEIVPFRNQISELRSQPNRWESENEEYIRGELERQSQIVREQDEDLDGLSESVGRIGEVGLAIHEELDSQEQLLTDVGREVDTVSARLDFVQKKLELAIKKAGAKGQIVMIVFMIVLLAVLVMLIFYT